MFRWGSMVAPTSVPLLAPSQPTCIPLVAPSLPTCIPEHYVYKNTALDSRVYTHQGSSQLRTLFNTGVPYTGEVFICIGSPS